MIKENTDVVRRKLGKLQNACATASQYLDIMKISEQVVTLTPTQKTSIMDGMESKKNDILEAYDALVVAFTATEEIIEEEIVR